jgi:hypothetical protein
MAIVYHPVTADAETPMPITACGPIDQPGSYALADNLFQPSGDCLTVSSDFVSIDLAGFSITSGDGSGSGIMSTRASGPAVTVKNSTISNFDFGISLRGRGNIVEGLRVLNTHNGGIEAVGIVKNNSVVNNGSFAAISGSGTVTDNYISTCDIGIQPGDGSSVRGNVVRDCRVGITAAEGTLLIGNTVRDNSSVGISVACPSAVIDNVATGSPLGQNIITGAGCVRVNNVAM